MSAVLIATPALAGTCDPADHVRYVAPPESVHAGYALRFYDGYVSDDDEPLLLIAKPCDMGTCYVDRMTDEFNFAILERDAKSAVVRMYNEPALRWPADCQ